MATDPASDLDVGPLSWVLPEIDQSLTRGVEALAQFRAASTDSAPLRHAQAHIHQAVGAIEMVGLDAVVPFSEEIERGLARLASIDPARVPAACDALDRACRKLRHFLAEVVAGTPLQALKLFPEYEAMQALRGIKNTAASDLFYPDLSARSSSSSAGCSRADCSPGCAATSTARARCVARWRASRRSPIRPA
jgi:chemosensory pili system protein ChpA (sensor histidine kinase/response regulator)